SELYPEALDWLRRYESAGAPPEHLLLERRLLQIQRGTLDQYAVDITKSLEQDFAEKDLVYEAMVRGFLASRRYTNADHYVTEWLELSPRRVAALLSKAHLLMERHDRDAAEKVLKTALEINPEHI